MLWRLGGAHSSFKLGPGASFYWQHDAEFQPGGLISVFDNGSDPPEEKQSRGLLLAPNFHAHTVSLVKQFVNPGKTLLASSQGNTLSLAGGNWLLGYGGLPNFTEFNDSGHVLLDGTLGPGRAELPDLPLSLERLRARGARGGRGSRRGRPERVGQLERVHRSGLLARARRSICGGAGAGCDGDQERFPDDDRGACRGPLRGGAGAQQLRRGHRCLVNGEGLRRSGLPASPVSPEGSGPTVRSLRALRLSTALSAAMVAVE